MLPYQSAIIEDGIVTGFRELHSDVVFPEDIGKVGLGPNDLEAFSCRHVKGPKIRTLVLPESVTLFGCYDIKFDGCRGLETLVFPVSLSTLNYSALFRCTASTIVLLSRELTMRDGTIDSMDCLVVAPNLPLSAFRPAAKEKAVAGFAQWYCSGAEMPERYRTDYLNYVRRQRKRLFGLALKAPDVLTVMTGEGILQRNEAEELLAQAEQQGRGEAADTIRAYLERLAPSAERKKPAAKRPAGSGPTAAELKALWSTKVRSNGALTLTRYKGNERNVVVPAKIGRAVVTAIGEECFDAPRGQMVWKFRRELDSVVIPEGIVEIGPHAFSATSLPALELPHSLRYIGFGAFANCIRLTKVEIPDGLEIVETTAFSGCTSLTRVTIPASVTQIGDRAFQDCPKLTIHAPAGSCAEQYAKDHNIPFQAL